MLLRTRGIGFTHSQSTSTTMPAAADPRLVWHPVVDFCFLRKVDQGAEPSATQASETQASETP